MKHALRFAVVAGIIAASLISLEGCGETSQKHAEDAKGNIQEAGEDLKEAAIAGSEETKARVTADWQQFKSESDSRIAVMEQQIVKLKAEIVVADKNRRDKLNRDLNKAEEKLKEQKEKLKQNSIEFEADLERFDESVVSKNESFKREFKRDMDVLDNSIKDLFKDNVK